MTINPKSTYRVARGNTLKALYEPKEHSLQLFCYFKCRPNIFIIFSMQINWRKPGIFINSMKNQLLEGLLCVYFDRGTGRTWKQVRTSFEVRTSICGPPRPVNHLLIVLGCVLDSDRVCHHIRLCRL